MFFYIVYIVFSVLLRDMIGQIHVVNFQWRLSKSDKHSMQHLSNYVSVTRKKPFSQSFFVLHQTDFIGVEATPTNHPV